MFLALSSGSESLFNQYFFTTHNEFEFFIPTESKASSLPKNDVSLPSPGPPRHCHQCKDPLLFSYEISVPCVTFQSRMSLSWDSSCRRPSWSCSSRHHSCRRSMMQLHSCGCSSPLPQRCIAKLKTTSPGEAGV